VRDVVQDPDKWVIAPPRTGSGNGMFAVKEASILSAVDELPRQVVPERIVFHRSA
jgi:hypothetical protein